jgi:hypothetical protein
MSEHFSSGLAPPRVGGAVAPSIDTYLTQAMGRSMASAPRRLQPTVEDEDAGDDEEM